MLGYADESGEPGLRKNYNDYFVFCIVLFNSRYTVDECVETIASFKQSQNLQDDHEFHYATDSKRIRGAFARLLSSFDFRFVSVAIKKDEHQKTASFIRMADAILSLLEKNRISARIIMDTNPRLYKELRTRKRNYNVDLHFSEKKSRGNSMVQVADYVTALKTRCIKHPHSSRAKSSYHIIAHKLLDEIIL